MSFFTYKVSVDSSGRRSLVRVSNHPRLTTSINTMRPWEREHPSSSSPPPEDSSPSSPPRPAKSSLSSLVVKPSADELFSSHLEDAPNVEKPTPEPRRLRADSPRRARPRRSSVDSGHNIPIHSARLSPCPRITNRHDDYFDHSSMLHDQLEIRGESSGGGFRGYPPSFGRRGRNTMREISPRYDHASDGERFAYNGEGFASNGERFASNGGMPASNGERFGKYSFPEDHQRGGRLRGKHSHHGVVRRFRDLSPPVFEFERNGPRYPSPGYARERGRDMLRFSPSYSPDRDSQKFRDISPTHDPERSGGRFRGTLPIYGRRKDARYLSRNIDGGPESEPFPFREEGSNRNNPNIPPRVGDWICRNPSCGNLNFARREYCNNCNKFRYEPGEGGQNSGPRRQYSSAPHPIDRPPAVPPSSSGFGREMNGYRSPTSDWPRDSPRGPLRDGARFPDIPVSRENVEYRRDARYRGKDKIDRLRPRDWDNQEHGSAELVRERRVYNDDDAWGPMDRSPVKSVLLKERRYDTNDDGWGPRKRGRSPPVSSLPPRERRYDDVWDPRERSRSPTRPTRPLARKDGRPSPFGGRGGQGDKRAFVRGRGRGLI